MITSDDGLLISDELADLASVLDRVGATRVLLVLDRGAARASNSAEKLTVTIGRRLADTFVDFTPNPACEQPLAAGRRAAELHADAIVAFGGGSCMDVAKVGALVAAAGSRGPDVARGGANTDLTPLPVIAIPTTSGTGAEATHFSAVYVSGKKISIAHPAMRPSCVILDADLHVAMPRDIAAATGLDALCQATESIWASGASSGSMECALRAQSAILQSLVDSITRPQREHRLRVMWGAHLAGRAINVSKTTAAHALSYELTTRFGVPHGLAVALTLGHVAAFNAELSSSDCTHPAGCDAAREVVRRACQAFGVAPADMPARLRGLLDQLDQPSTLARAGVPRDALRPMADAADTVRLSNNPRRLSPADALHILDAAY